MDTSSVILTKPQLTYYHTFGFIVLKGVLTPDEMNVINSEFEVGLEAAHRYNPGVGWSRQFQWSNLGPGFPVTANLLEDSRICGLAEQIIGKDDQIVLTTESTIFKILKTPEIQEFP